MNQSAQLFSRARAVIPGGVNSPVRAFRNVDGDPFFVQSAKGAYITDADGRQLIDYIGTWGPAILGHAPQTVLNAVHAAVDRGLGYGIPAPAEVDMAEMITGMVPSVEKVRMVNSGTEATMSAIRLARGYTGRRKIIKFIGCYHGHVDSLLVAAGSGALTFGEPDSAGVPREMIQLTITVPYNDREAVKKAFELHGSDIAAVILEPFPANAGLYFPQNDFLHFLREITLRHDSLLIFDEVMTGFRVAPGGVQQLHGITPDLTCMGKVIGGGLPVGAFGGRAEIMDCLSPIGPVYQAGTLSGNPVAMAAGLAQLRELLDGNAYDRLEQLGARLEEGIREAIRKHGRNYTFHRAGSMFCLFFTEQEVYDLDSAQKASKELFKPFFWNMLEQGVYFAPSPYETGFISTAHTEEDIDRTVEAVHVSLSKLG
ncbi:glutamate-1-semialdehyde 2,1-aminomutase [Akkermansia sp. Marseille-P9185]|uniref:glutamate-1-semialdehyde 2,1-aminomutase n=1 Tax=Akkermansia TaxID=239934 RepID=UPI00209C3593|nr:glutamate-1-semialdehyde 2,1-aminomutase [Akkermansia massiliensis]MCO8187325.1 glutamate-1-semialdehyde 2,1-aminomutase [Akkermansia massiliensis]